MSTTILASIWFSVSSVLSAYYCLDRHPVLKPLVTPRHDTNKTVASNLFYVRLSAARNIANVKVREARVFMICPLFKGNASSSNSEALRFFVRIIVDGMGEMRTLLPVRTCRDHSIPSRVAQGCSLPTVVSRVIFISTRSPNSPLPQEGGYGHPHMRNRCLD
jgi:hypothetical protein